MEVLDQIEEEKNKFKSLCNFMDRVRHMAVDFIIIFVLSLLTFFNFSQKYFTQDDGKTGNIMLVTMFVIYILYYLIWESLAGRTLGKFLNKTQVVNTQQENPTIKQVLIRLATRLIPFQFVTYFTPYQKPLHDILSKTWVMRK
jgi:uncharacterized RDD family membrane protein YckC|tara:strand:+ start:17 stop:445 length:429 start_codon:yes stop_codon:yes gene_type:complete